MMLRLLALCTTVWLVTAQTSRNLAADTCNADQNRVQIQPDADAMLVGLIGMRGPEANGVGCGRPDEVMLPAYEAIKWTIGRLNTDNGMIDGQTITQSYIPGVKIGMTVYDTCTSAKVATEKVISAFQNYYVPSRYCSEPENKLNLGIIGASRSVVSKELAGWLSRLKGPMVSFSSGVVSLGDVSEYPYFMRTVPANVVQAQVVVELLAKLAWTKVSIVHADDPATKEDYEQILRLGNRKGICVTQGLAAHRQMSNTDVVRILNKLKDSDTHGVVYIGFREEVYELLSEISSVQGANDLQWIFSGSISPDNDFVQKSFQTRQRGFIAVSPNSHLTTEFRDYFTSIDERTDPADNPWFKEWYMTVHNCKLPGINYAPYVSMISCALKTTQQKRDAYIQNQYVAAAIDSVMVYAKALKNAHAAVCFSQRGVCQALKNMETDRFYRDYLLKVQLTYSTQERIRSWTQGTARTLRFDPSGEVAVPKYDVWNYNNRANSQQYTVMKVGSYENRQLNLNLASIVMYDAQRSTALTNLPTYACQPSGCGICQQSNDPEKYIQIDGDVLINGIVSVHEGTAGRCGAVSAAGGAQTEAFVYAIKTARTKLNIMADIDLGAIGYDDCQSGSRAVGFIEQFEGGVLNQLVKSGAGDPYTSNDVPVYVAAQGNEATKEVADLLTRLKVPQISYGATTTELGNLKKYPYFMRSVPTISKQFNAIVQVLKQMDWLYVQVVYSPDIHGRSGSRDFIQEAAANQICVTAAYEMGTTYTAAQLVTELKARPDAKVVIVIASEPSHYRDLLTAIQGANEAGKILLIGDSNWGNDPAAVTGVENTARGSLTVDMKDPVLNEFLTYLRSLDVRTYETNPWFRVWYERVYGCYLIADSMPLYTQACDPTKPITDAPNFKVDSSVLSIINSVYLSARGIHTALEKVCGAGYTTVCNEFKQYTNRANLIVSEMEQATFTDMTSTSFSLESREAHSDFIIYNYRSGGYAQVGTFNTAGAFQFNKNFVQYYSSPITSVCSGSACDICLQKVNQILFEPGDVYIASLLDIHHPGDSVYTCGDIKRTNGFQKSEVFAYALDLVNTGQAPVKLNGVRLGGIGLDDCSSSFQASNLIWGVYSGALPLGKDGRRVQPDMIKVWLSYGAEETVSAAEELTRRQVPLISPSASSTALSDVSKYPTFFRTVPNDFLLTQSMVRLFLALDWGCVQIVYDSTSYGRTGYRTFRQNAKDQKLCVTQCLELGTDGTYAQIVQKLVQAPSKAVVVIADGIHIPKLLAAKANNATANNIIFIGSSSWGRSKNIVKGHENSASMSLTLTVDSPNIPGFDTYLRGKFPNQYTRNPWFEDYYKALFQCDFVGENKYGRQCNNPSGTPLTQAPDYEQGSWVVSTMDAVFAATQALDLTLKDICGANYQGMCPAFVSQDVSQHIIGNLGKVSFQSARGKTFAFNSRSGGVGYDIYQYKQRQYSKVGYTTGLSPTLNDPTAIKQEYSSTPTTCTPCEECPLDIDTIAEQFLYIPGDLLLGGVFDVHKRGLFPFTCDTIRPQYSYQLTEAFAFAIEQINSKQGVFSDKLRGITLGGVALDSCESAIRAGNLISDFHSGVIQLSKNGETVDPKKVKAYIGAFSTDRSMQMADVLNEVGLPQISYAAAGMGLHDEVKYPLFSRTIPANKKQVKGIIEFLKKYEINSVQVINSPGPYGEDGANEFIKAAIQEKICVSQNITFRDNGTVTDYSATEVVNLLLNRVNSTVVVAFLETDYINRFLRRLHGNAKARGRFRFVASEAWGKNTRVYEGAETEVRNTVAFNIDTGNVPGFDDYLGSKFPNTYIRNPWLPAYFQEIYKCTLPGSSLSYPRACSVIDKSIVNDDYHQEAYVMYVVDAVYSAAIGLDQTLRDICGHNYTGICDEWRSDMDPKTHLLKGIRQANFTDPAIGQKFKFVDEGESIRGFEIYSLERYDRVGAVLEYNLIGRYQHLNDTEMQLTVSPSYDFDYSSNCNAERSCYMCPYMRVERSRYMKKATTEHLNMIGFFGVHKTGSNYLSCGHLSVENGFMETLAFFYGLHLVNDDKGNQYEDTIKIGGLAIDDCSSINRMRSELYSFLRDDGLCLAARKEDLFEPKTVYAYLTGHSESSIVAAELLTPKERVSISQSMLHPVNTKDHYPFLLRTLPNCGRRGAAAFDLLDKNKWSFFMVVYTDDECGRAGLENMNKRARQKGYCLGLSRMMTMAADEERAVSIVKELNENPHGNVVALLTTEEHSHHILRAITRLNLHGRFVLILTDPVDDIPADLQTAALGSLKLDLAQHPVPGFAHWVATMNNTNRLGLPEDWFHEFWQHVHKCHIRTAAIVLTQYLSPCTMNEVITKDMINQDDDVLHTIMSTFVVAKGLNTLQRSDTCTGRDIDECLSTMTSSLAKKLFDAMRGAEFQVLPQELGNDTFRHEFTDDNDAPLIYTVYNYQKNANMFEFEKVGSCHGSCEMSSTPKYYDKDGKPRTDVRSQCPQDEAACVCESRVEPVFIRPAPDVADQFTEIFGIIIIVLNLLGMLISFILFFHFICFYPNKGGTTVLGYIALFGVFILFAFNFAYVFYPHYVVCGVRRFGQGVIYSIIFGAFAVKCMCTWKNTNVSDDFLVHSKKRYTHPFGLSVIAFCFVAVQVMIVIQWLILEPPMAENIIYHGQYWPRCMPHAFYNQGLVLSLLYVMFLMALTLGFSGFSWPSSENNFEARYILGSTVFVMGTWMVWCIVSTMTEVKYRDGATAIGNIFCGYGIVFFVFFRKCYLLHKFRRQKYGGKLGRDEDKPDGMYDNYALEKDADQLSDKSSGHGSL